jgi:hypothetical protein
MTLSSNVNSIKDFGVPNKIAQFKTKLGKTIQLQGEWEVGVSEIFYTKSWYNIINTHIISLFDEMGKTYEMPNNMNEEMFTISNGYYETAQKLIGEINKILNLFTDIKPPKILYNELNNCATIQAGKIENSVNIYPFLGEEIENILGLRNRSLKSFLYTNTQRNEDLSDYIFRGGDMYRKESFKAFHPVEITGGHHSLYLYTDIVYPTLVGDSFSQLLRVVEVPRKCKFNETAHLIYDRIQYMPVMLNNFETIEISIKDDTDNLVPFMCGRSTVILHFKKL